MKVFDFCGQTSAKGAIKVSKGIAKSTCEDSYRTGVDIVHEGARSFFEIPSRSISYDSLRSLLPKVRYKSLISLLLQVLLALTPSLKQADTSFPFIHGLG